MRRPMKAFDDFCRGIHRRIFVFEMWLERKIAELAEEVRGGPRR